MECSSSRWRKRVLQRSFWLVLKVIAWTCSSGRWTDLCDVLEFEQLWTWQFLWWRIFFLFFCLNSWLCKLYKQLWCVVSAGKALSVLAIHEGHQPRGLFGDMFPVLLSKCSCHWGQRVAQRLDQWAGDKWDSAQQSHANRSLRCLGPLARWDVESWCLSV